jgi:hypothetical protein
VDLSRDNIAELRRVGLTAAEYHEIIEDRAAVEPAGLDPDDAERVGFTRLNLFRTDRITRTWTPSPELIRLLDEITKPQIWMVLTEPWCGDSAQILPIIALLADRTAGVELLIVLRDDHPAIMDRYLTDGKRSIPQLVSFDPEGRELFRWGPRPAAAQAVFDAAKAAGLDKPDILEKLHLFYGRDRGAAIEAALAGALGAARPDRP